MADTSVHWSIATGKGWNYLWSLGHTPFGPLSTSTTLSFVQRDAALRNLAIATINGSIAHIQHLLDGFMRLSHPEQHVKALLQPQMVRLQQQTCVGRLCTWAMYHLCVG